MSPAVEGGDAAVLLIGAELLSGKIVDENGPFLIRCLRERGVAVRELRLVDDDINTIVQALHDLGRVADFVITTGGIGPTHDDVTIAAVAAAQGRRVVRDPGLEARIRGHYGDRCTDAHLRLAEIPEGAELRAGDAPLPTIVSDKVVVLPGVPSLMRLCFSQVAHLFSGRTFYTHALFLDVSETTIAAHLDAVQRDHPGVAIGSYPRFDAAPYRVKVTVDSRDDGDARAAMVAVRRGIPPEAVVELPDEDEAQLAPSPSAP